MTETVLIALEEGVLVEVSVPDEQAEQIAGGGPPFATGASLKQLTRLAQSISQPLAECMNTIKEGQVGEVEVELGVKFGLEGNLILAKSTGDVNLVLRMTIK
jgi:hypothetical protein